jgi:hypothetical protein
MKHVSNEYNYTRLTTQSTGTIQIVTGYAVLHYITVNLTSAATIGIVNTNYKNLSATSTVGRIKASPTEGSFFYDVGMSQGIRIVASGHLGDVTVVWSQG